MAFLVEYYREGRLIGSTPWGGTLDATKHLARRGVKMHKADFARVMNDASGAEVWSIRDDGSESD